jgi:hypothetical protein
MDRAKVVRVELPRVRQVKLSREKTILSRPARRSQEHY